MMRDWVASIGRRRLLLAVFRITTLFLALLELSFDSPAASLVPDIAIVVGAVLYTVFKLLHPFRWYLAKPAGAALIIGDVVICAFFLIVHREIHAPFALYSLNPVITAALLFSPRFTWVTSVANAVYYTANFFSFPVSEAFENLSSMFFTHIALLGLSAMLPYLINADALQKLKSRAIAEERLVLSREIHDGLCQTIYGLRLEIQQFYRDIKRTGQLDGEPRYIRDLLDEAEAEARGSMEFLRLVKDDRPLLARVEESLQNLQNDTGIVYQLETSEGEPRLDDIVRLEVLTICEEALRNVAKHSGAKQVRVSVAEHNGSLEVSIADDGRGIKNAAFSDGHGLQVMKERAASVGGNLQVISPPGGGTEIRLEVPKKWFPEPLVAR